MKKICIIGGGISGLVSAYLLKQKDFEVTLFDKNETVGGNIQSRKIAGFLIEQGPNSLLKSPRLVDLIKSLDLENELLPTKTTAKKRYVLQNGKLKALPMSIAKMVFGDFFSLKAKLRLLKEPFIKTKSSENESVADFFERRLGKEIVEKAADPRDRAGRVHVGNRRYASSGRTALPPVLSWHSYRPCRQKRPYLRPPSPEDLPGVDR